MVFQVAMDVAAIVQRALARRAAVRSLKPLVSLPHDWDFHLSDCLNGL
jgi:hypothetical protein